MRPVRYTVVVPLKPVPKGRHRIAVVGGKARAFTPKATEMAENWIRMCVVKAVGTPRVPGPVAFHVTAVMPMPKSMPHRDRADALAGRKLHTSRADIDNIVKLAGDALIGIAFADDAHVSSIRAVKAYGLEPRTIITWWQMTPEECAMEAAAMGLLSADEAAALLV